MRFPNRLLCLVATLALLLVACGESNEVGGGVGEVDESKTNVTRLGETTAPPETTTTTGSGPTTTAKGQPTTTATTAKPAASIEIIIQSDTKGSPFVPTVAQVLQGSTVRWKNTDSVARSVVFSDESYDSGPIAPGGTAEYAANRVGNINYTDGTRPYAVASLRVEPRR